MPSATAGSYNWATADELITWASANGIAVRGHTLCWHSQTPDWLTTGTAAEVRTKLETYVRDVVTHFKGKVYCWDVVNECTSDDASGAYRNSSGTRSSARTTSRLRCVRPARPTPMPSSSSTTTAPKTPPSCRA